ncbi:MAG TPA: LuxR C-terminal-related transcriptional regulator [Polyangiaceae bacterium]|nr:LuxR C-terminal-related transcriptional regulator [Polyangiaceae bacterium]
MSRVNGIRAATAIDVVEAAYRLDGTESAWLTALLEQASKDLDTGSGVYAFTGNDSLPDFAKSPVFVQQALSPAFLSRIATLNADAPNAIFELLKKRVVTCGGLEQVLGSASPVVTHFRELMASAGIADGFCMFAQDARGGSVTVSAPSRAVLSPPPRVRGVWQRVGLHVVAGLRLRRLLAASATQRDALLSPAGKLEDASSAVADNGSARGALIDAVRSMEQARKASVRSSPDRALELWRGLVAGQWSLVDHWEGDGRRYVAAFSNGLGLRDPRGLTATEQSVLRYLTLGATNKEASYALGLSEKTVSKSVSQILKKFGVKSRVDLAAMSDAARATRFDLAVENESVSVLGVDVALDRALADRLTSAERTIAELVARGWSNARIAAERGVAVSTIAKQLQAIYDKLGVENRSRLARAIAEGG